MTTSKSSPGTATLLATGCGTALASVCAIGLHQIRNVLGGVWSLGAVVVAGLLCAALARVFTRLSSVVPSGVGVLAFLSRAFGRRAGLALTVPYLLFTLALVGVEARIVGTLLSHVVPVRPLVGALAFVTVTWAVCRRGQQPGYRAQVLATWALVALLGALSVAAIAARGFEHTLSAHLLPARPSLGAFAVGVGNALFLFMGFELVTSHVHSGRASLGPALRGSVVVLTVVYGVAALGFSALPLSGAATVHAWVGPALAMAASAAGKAGVGIVVAVVLLASFTSFNGALLALSRLVAALAAQRRLPTGLAKMDPVRMVPPRALATLTGLSMTATIAFESQGAALVVIAGAAAAVSLVYAASLWARERPPFAEPGRHRGHQVVALALGTLLLVFGVGALADVLLMPARSEIAVEERLNHGH